MSDRTQWNTRERATSGKLNSSTALLRRTLHDLIRYWMRYDRVQVAVAGAPLSTTRGNGLVMGGLGLFISGSDILVGAGALTMFSSTVPAVPGADDSGQRIGILRATATTTPPSPGADTWYLLEAQVDETTTVASRDIWNTTLEVFQATSVNDRLSNGITFQYRAGTSTDFPSAQANWVPIAAVFRPNGGGAIDPEDVIDLRALPNDFAHTKPAYSGAITHDIGIGSRRIHTASTVDTRSTEVDIEVEAYSRGQHLWFRAPDADLGTAEYLEPGIVLTDSVWYYIYLAPWAQVYAPSRVAPGLVAVNQRGVLVLSDKAPLQGRSTNNATITPPAPYNGAGVFAVADCVCVGALRYDGIGGGWEVMHDQNGDVMCERINLTASGASPTFTFDTADIPRNAKLAKVRFNNDTTGGVSGFWEIAFPGELNQYQSANYETGVRSNFEFEAPLPFDVGTTPFVQMFANGGGVTVTSAAMSLIGWQA